jgi:dTDP-4-dehydrorhamnose reductase
MKVLITGGSGLLGQFLNIEISRNNRILTLYSSNTGNCLKYNSIKTDIRDSKSLYKILSDFKPDVVIHAASVSTAKTASLLPPKEVFRINVEATKNIAEYCMKLNSRLIYISTDQVYAGYRGSMLKEDAKLIPISLYAETKLMGEVKVMENSDNYIILRLSLLYGIGLNHSENHFHRMYNTLKEGKPVKLFTDQYRTPLSLREAARIINEIAKLDARSEIINTGGRERVSRYKLGEVLCEVKGLNKELLVKTTMDDMPDIPKVEDVSMNTDKLRSYGIGQKNIYESVKEIFLEE